MLVAVSMIAIAVRASTILALVPPGLFIVALFSRTNDVGRYIMAAGFAASEVAGLMMIVAIINRTTGMVPLLGGIGGSAMWFWWSRSPVAARFTLAAVVSIVITTVKPIVALAYAVLFIVAIFIHAMLSRKKLAPSACL